MARDGAKRPWPLRERTLTGGTNRYWEYEAGLHAQGSATNSNLVGITAKSGTYDGSHMESGRTGGTWILARLVRPTSRFGVGTFSTR